MKSRHVLIAAAGLALAAAGTGDAHAQNFFQGKTVTLTVGFGPGGGYDAYTRLMAAHLGKHIPGNPNVVVQNKPGGGSSVAAAYLYGPARQDGTELGVFNSQLALAKVLGEPAPFDVTKFTYVGRLVRALNLALVRTDAPATTLEGAKKVEVVLAASGPNSATTRIPMAFNRMVDSKFKVLRGYGSSAKMAHAFEQNEVHGIGGTSMTALQGNLKHMIDKKQVRYLWVTATDRHPDLPDVPAAPELLKDPEQRRIMELICSSSDFGYALWGPPKLRGDRLEVLRTAFDAMIKDRDFLADAERRKLDLEPQTGAYLDKVMKNLADAPEDIIKKAQELSKP